MAIVVNGYPTINSNTYFDNDLSKKNRSLQNIQHQTALLSVMQAVIPGAPATRDPLLVNNSRSPRLAKDSPRDDSPMLVQLEVWIGQGFTLAQAIELLDPNERAGLPQKYLQTILNLSKSSHLDM